ncbi:MAG: hypothetical protein A2275_18325 [Bacteroidetes bacterium RIFOXYA12_FULL_35_11]|nr:MAG: hypothetical protein A2X01_15055 [Bacteroidetes bacterium GWF2_35_48]OFY82735.1 MAG: hypothetical protein A2275_18325 [Bacteroidetes bacterium RIFOXYA12_FULL_35_11]
MKLLHTSDWHLGARLLNKDREEEQLFFLNELVELIKTNNINLLIIAGDIFDTGVPSNSARKMYYLFLTQLIGTCCEHIVITGGNHDSPSMLEAPKEVLELLNIYVIGAAETNENGEINFDHEIIKLHGINKDLHAVIAAVPFLRDRDIMKSVAGQSFEDRIAAMRQGLRNHYQHLAELLSEYKEIPIIATGHLFAQKSVLPGNDARQEGENDIHIGNLAQVDMSEFYSTFSYMALGHIHKAQKPGGFENIRYSGSPLCMSFSEFKDEKTITVVEFENENFISATDITLSKPRQIVRFKGNEEILKNEIENYSNPNTLTAWAEIIFTEPFTQMSLDALNSTAKEKNIEILKYTLEEQKKIQTDESEKYSGKTLQELTPEDLLEMKCIEEGYTEEQIKEIKQSFQLLTDLMHHVGT